MHYVFVSFSLSLSLFSLYHLSFNLLVFAKTLPFNYLPLFLPSFYRPFSEHNFFSLIPNFFNSNPPILFSLHFSLYLCLFFSILFVYRPISHSLLISVFTLHVFTLPYLPTSSVSPLFLFLFVSLFLSLSLSFPPSLCIGLSHSLFIFSSLCLSNLCCPSLYLPLYFSLFLSFFLCLFSIFFQHHSLFGLNLIASCR
jgi:hypothetical protein